MYQLKMYALHMYDVSLSLLEYALKLRYCSVSVGLTMLMDLGSVAAVEE